MSQDEVVTMRVDLTSKLVTFGPRLRLLQGPTECVQYHKLHLSLNDSCNVSQHSPDTCAIYQSAGMIWRRWYFKIAHHFRAMWCRRFTRCCQGVIGFRLVGRFVVERLMQTLGIATALDVFEHAHSRRFQVVTRLLIPSFILQRAEARSHHGVVPDSGTWATPGLWFTQF